MQFALPTRSAANRPPRILFVGEAVSLAHIGRPAVLARMAKEAGYDVHFACGSAIASVARREGFEPHDLETIEPGTFYARLKLGKFFYTADELEAYVRAEIALIERVKPDLVVADFRLSLDTSTTLTGVPLMSLCNAHWSPDGVCRFSAPDFGLLGWIPKLLRDALFPLLRPIAFRTFARPLNQMRKRFGLRPLKDFRQAYTAGRFCGYVDIPELFPRAKSSSAALAGRLPNGHVVVGPVPWAPHNPAPAEFDRLGGNRPLAYVSLGSSGDVSVLPNVLRSLLALDCDIALSGLRAEQYAAFCRDLPTLAERSASAPLYDPSAVLKKASVTICHGGSGTVYQSLAAGVPLLCLPGNPDQELVTAGVAASGAAISLFAADAVPEKLTPALRALLRGSIASTFAQMLADSVKRCDTRRNWLKFLSRVLPLDDEGATRPIPAAAGLESERAIHRLPALRALAAERNYSSVLVERLERFLDETGSSSRRHRAV